MAGKLKLTIVEAKLSRDTEYWGKMDPFVVLKYNKEEHKTKEIENAGSTPKWNKSFDIGVKRVTDNIIIEVYDVDVFDNELIGAGIAHVENLCVDKQKSTWFTVNFKGELAGQILIESEWTPTVKGESKQKDT